MVKSQSDKSPPRRSRQRGRSQPPSLRKTNREDLRYPTVPLERLKAHFLKGGTVLRRAAARPTRAVQAIRRTLTPNQKLLLVRARFGSLTDFSRPRASFAAVARHFHMRSSTVWNVINSFVQNGHRIIDRRCFNHRTRRAIGSPEFEEFLVRKDTLQKWAALTLKERARKLFHEHGVYVHHLRLRAFYRMHRIRFKRPQPAYRADIEQAERLGPRRAEYARMLASLVVEGAPIIYLDESSVNVWMTKSRCWQPMDSPVNVILNKPRHKGITIYGAIGHCLARPVMMLGESTNAVEFIKFLQQVLAGLRPEYRKRKPYLVIDNASAHIEADSRRFLAEHFAPINVPPYSCQFNSIEHLWSVLKNNIRKLILDHGENIDEPTWRDMIQRAWDMIDGTTFTAMVGANRKYVSDLLDSL